MPFKYRRRQRSSGSSGGTNRRQVEVELVAYGGTASAGVPKAADWLIFPADYRHPFPGSLSGLKEGVITIPNLTLIRTRVNFFAQTGVIPAAAWATLGVGILEWESKNASVPPITELPSPLDDSADWIWQLEVPFTKAPASQTQAASLVDTNQITSRAMRKLPSGSGVLIISEYRTLAGSPANIEFAATCQLWVKLPK